MPEQMGNSMLVKRWIQHPKSLYFFQKSIFFRAFFSFYWKDLCFGTTTFVCDACQHHLGVWRHVPIYIIIWPHLRRSWWCFKTWGCDIRLHWEILSFMMETGHLFSSLYFQRKRRQKIIQERLLLGKCVVGTEHNFARHLLTIEVLLDKTPSKAQRLLVL